MDPPVLKATRTRNTFSSLGAEEHLQCRRRLAITYAKSYIQRSPHVRIIVSTVLFERYMPIIRESARNEATLNILHLNFAYGLDFVSAFIFGMCRSTNFIENAKARDHWLTAYLKSHPANYMFWLLELPKLINYLKRIGMPIVPKWSLEAHDVLDQWALELVDKTEDAIAKRPVKDMSAAECPVLYNQLRLAITEEQQKGATEYQMAPSPQQRLQLASECLDHLGIYSPSSLVDVMLTGSSSCY